MISVKNTNIIKKENVRNSKKIVFNSLFFIIKKESSEFHEFDFFNEKEKK